MPFKSEAQRRKFGQLVKLGKMKQTTFDEWNKDTAENLPDRIGEKPVRSIDDIKERYKKRFPGGK